MVFEKAAESSASVPWFQLLIVPFALAVLRYALVDTGHGGAPGGGSCWVTGPSS
ncbi:hypothetical protein [Aquihabitans sp. G128]|uniref:hypothetical protein n=1 Tax=Aquihabitans sp. G128 TaxID=2849779 RepID=UPI0020B429F1|nr:hypothetical protein [Aquihabitans sp. G128]